MTAHFAFVKKLPFFLLRSLRTTFAWVAGMTLFPVGPAACTVDMLFYYYSVVLVPELLLISCELYWAFSSTTTFSYASSNLIVPCRIVFAFLACPTVIGLSPRDYARAVVVVPAFADALADAPAWAMFAAAAAEG